MEKIFLQHFFFHPRNYTTVAIGFVRVFIFEYSLLLTSIVVKGPHLRRVTLHALDKGLDVGLSGNALSYHLLDQCTCLQTRVYLLLFNPPKIFVV